MSLLAYWDEIRKRAWMPVAEEAAQEADRVQDQADEAGGLPRDEQFWFEDGSIILHARDVAFKVYAKPLTDHSPVFKDMLSLPQPDDSVFFKSAGRDIPVVSLTDSPKDLRHMFEVIMPTKTLRPFGFETISYHTISAWIRLGHKYQIQDLVEQSLVYLRDFYPDNYGDYIDRPKLGRFPRLHAIGVVNLARFTDAHYLLPIALMECCALDAGIVGGFPREDGTIERLCTADLELCFKAKEKLIEARYQLPHHIANSVFDRRKACVCDSLLKTFLEDIARGRHKFRCTPQPFLLNYAFFKDNIPDLCGSCINKLSKSSKDEKCKLFGRLPALMGITVDGWCQQKGAARK